VETTIELLSFCLLNYPLSCTLGPITGCVAGGA